MILREMKLGDVIEMTYMQPGFRIGRVVIIDDDGVTIRRAYIGYDGKPGGEDCFFTFTDTRIDATWFQVLESSHRPFKA
jgi:hypothetical protein